MNAETNAAGHTFSQDSEANADAGEATTPNKRSVDTRPLTRAMNKTGKSSSAFKTISEVADELGVQQHVLRFWETKFSQIKPLKRGGGRRYYRPEDVELIQSIQHLLYTEGYTIKGVQKLMRQQGKKSVVEYAKQADSLDAPVAAQAVAAASSSASLAGSLSGTQREVLATMLEDLKELRDLIKSE